METHLGLLPHSCPRLAARRPFLLLLVALFACGTVGGRALAAQLDRPNFVFVYTDDQRFDCLGVVQREQGEKGRFPWLKTPNLDRLASEGIHFRNGFVVQSLCTPSRASFLTGQYTHTHNIYTNFTPFPDSAEHWGRALGRAGYQTAYIGKWHMGDQGGQRPGFTYSASYRGQGKYFDCPFEVDGETTATTGWVDGVATDYAMEFIRRQQDRPFAVALGFKSPHVTFEPSDEFADLYPDAQMGPAQNHMNFPIYLGRVHLAKPEHLKSGGNRVTPDYIDYFRTITAIDHHLGRLLDLLDELNLAENTVVIFSSDNGYHFGEHGIGDKRSAYEVSMRVPMIVRYPASGRRGVVHDGLVLNIDVAPTILDLAGLPVPTSMQGRSWQPLIDGTQESVRDGFLYEYFFSYTDITDYEIQTANPPITPTIVAYRTPDAKLITYPDQGWVELFDLTSDPYEQINLAQRPDSKPLLQRMSAALQREQERTGFKLPENYEPVPDDQLEPWRR